MRNKQTFLSIYGFNNDADSVLFESFNNELEIQKIYDDMVSKNLTETSMNFCDSKLKITIVETDNNVNLGSFKDDKGIINDFYSVEYRER